MKELLSRNGAWLPAIFYFAFEKFKQFQWKMLKILFGSPRKYPRKSSNSRSSSWCTSGCVGKIWIVKKRWFLDYLIYLSWRFSLKYLYGFNYLYGSSMLRGQNVWGRKGKKWDLRHPEPLARVRVKEIRAGDAQDEHPPDSRLHHFSIFFAWEVRKIRRKLFTPAGWTQAALVLL